MRETVKKTERKRNREKDREEDEEYARITADVGATLAMQRCLLFERSQTHRDVENDANERNDDDDDDDDMIHNIKDLLLPSG